MKLTLVVDLQLSAGQRRCLVAGVAVAGALVASVAFADAPRTFATGETLKAADLNASFAALDASVAALDARVTGVEQRPRSRVAVDSVLSFSAVGSSATKVPFATERYDDLEEFDPISGTFTPADGDYEVCVTVNLPYSVADESWIEVFVDNAPGGVIAWYDSGSSHNFGKPSSGCRTLRLDAGDVVDIRVVNPATESFTVNDSLGWLTVNQLD